MRAALLTLAALLCTVSAASAATTIRVSAQHVEFYYDRFLLEADGGVTVRTSDGMTLSGDAFSMDLKLNRFLLAGHVHAQDPAGAQDGAALADFLDFKRIYLVPITTEPDRWTFLDGDFAHPAKGREMPGDTFFFPDLGQAKPYVKTTSAVVGARSYVRFTASRVDVAYGAGAYAVLPSYYINFSNDEHLGENSLSGSNYDATYQFAGSANAISALHVRYDTQNKAYLGFEQHLSASKAYAVFSVNPFTRPSKFWNLLAADKPSDNFQIRLFEQLHTYQYGLRSPLEATLVSSVQLTQGFKRSYAQLSAQQVNFSLIPRTIDPNHGIVPNHPFSLQLTAQTFDNRIFRTPLYEHLTFGAGYTHDAYTLQTIGANSYRTVGNESVGAQVYLPSFKLTQSLVSAKNYYVNASYQKTRTWYSTPHSVDMTNATAGISRSFDNHFNAFTSYTVDNVGDYYLSPYNQFTYVPFVPTIGGTPYPGYAAFRGVATFRTAALAVTYSNAGNTSASLLFRKHDDFPKPIPNLFAPPPLNVLGRPITAIRRDGRRARSGHSAHVDRPLTDLLLPLRQPRLERLRRANRAIT
ncbi:MAG: hypothetical protein ABR508_12285 [Candidatus Baltobacteraceae bacterium]